MKLRPIKIGISDQTFSHEVRAQNVHKTYQGHPKNLEKRFYIV